MSVSSVDRRVETDTVVHLLVCHVLRDTTCHILQLLSMAPYRSLNCHGPVAAWALACVAQCLRLTNSLQQGAIAVNVNFHLELHDLSAIKSLPCCLRKKARAEYPEFGIASDLAKETAIAATN